MDVPCTAGVIAITITFAVIARIVVPFMNWSSGAWAFVNSSVLWSVSAAAALWLHLVLSPSQAGQLS